MSESPSKRHKKHKKHKHKSKRHPDDGEADDELVVDLPPGGSSPVGLGLDESTDVDVTSPSQPAIKLKIKLGSPGQTMGSAIKDNRSDPQVTKGGPDDVVWNENQVKGDVFTTKKAGDDTSDEEREWLDALEKGTLDDSGAITKKRDRNLLTTRQRALIHGERNDDMLLQLPSGYKVPEFTEEQLKRRQQRAKKRREQAMEKQEKDKKQTLDRLLKKQEAKMKGGKTKGSKRAHIPAYRYSSTSGASSISVPQGFKFPFPHQVAPEPPTSVLCGVSGCKQQKKYCCSKTGVPLCSLECYKTNLKQHNQHQGNSIAIST